MVNVDQHKGFFASLFDFSFTSFITLKFLKVIYAVMVGLILLMGLGFFLGLASKGGGGAVLALVVVPIATLAYLMFARMWLEIVAILFRIGENTSILAAAARGGASGPSATGYGYGQPPQGGQPPAPPAYGQ